MLNENYTVHIQSTKIYKYFEYKISTNWQCNPNDTEIYNLHEQLEAANAGSSTSNSRFA